MIRAIMWFAYFWFFLILIMPRLIKVSEPVLTANLSKEEIEQLPEKVKNIIALELAR